ncbi:MAG: OmpA family protein [Acidimicrobiales bacterium]
MSRSPRPLISLAAATLAFALGACGASGSDVAKTDSKAVPAASTTTNSENSTDGSSREVTTTTVSETTTTVAEQTKTDPACRPGKAKTVEDLPDVKIAAFHADAFDSPDDKLGDTVVPGVHVAAIDLPAQTVEGGCIVRYDAPGGCLGRVTISSASIPGRSIPGASLSAVKVDGETLFSGDRAQGDRTAGDEVEGDDVKQECRVESSDRYKAAVGRAAASRAALSRAALSRPALSRPSLCAEVDGEQKCTDSVYVDSVYVDSEYVDSVYVDSEYLPSEHLDGAPETEVLTGGDAKAYVTPAAVLFDFDKSDLKPGAIPTLQAIATQIKGLPVGSKIQVDGHTDDKGTDAYNEQLSTKRADAVAAWLNTNGGVPADRITTKGYGETVPVATNDTEANRAKNRRVVISVTNP